MNASQETLLQPVLDGDFKNQEDIRRNIAHGVNDLKADDTPSVAELVELGNRIELDCKTLRDRLALITQDVAIELGTSRQYALEQIAGLSDRSKTGSDSIHVPGEVRPLDQPSVAQKQGRMLGNDFISSPAGPVPFATPPNRAEQPPPADQDPIAPQPGSPGV